jgi:chaperonin cofactor prefoldin
MTNLLDQNNPEDQLRRKLDRLHSRFDDLKSDIARLESKLDIILQHITGIAE